MKRVVLIVAGLAAIVAIASAIYFYQLTADVDVSDASPVAKTLVVPTSNAAISLPVIVGGGESSAATPATDPTTAAPTTAAPTTAAAQVYRIDAAQSVATYTVSETFLDDNRVGDAIGTTSAIAGDILIDRANPSASQIGEIVVDISQLTSDNSRRDNAIRRNWLESAKYPLATFNNGTISDLPGTLSEGTPFTFKITGDMTIHDTTSPVIWNVTMTLDGNTLRGSATTEFKMSDFNVQAPDIAGIVKAEDDVLLTLDIVANAVQ